MNNLLRITTKPIKISVQVEKGKYIKVEHALKLQTAKHVNTDINRIKKQESIVQTNKLKAHNSVQALPKNIKLNEIDNTIQTIIKQNYTQEDSKNITYLSQYSHSAKIEPIANEIEMELKYQPSDLNFVVSQYSEIEFEYVGDPIYIPASANPNKEK